MLNVEYRTSNQFLIAQFQLLLVLSVRLSPLDIDPLLKPVASIKTFK